MPVENVTANRGYELPDVSNDLDFDVFRLINALGAIDLDMQTALNDIATKAALDHVHPITDVTGLQAALDGKASTSHTHALNGLSNVNAPTPGTNHVLRFDGTQWLSGALDAGWITLGTVAEARLPVWLSQANISAKADLVGATFTGNVTVSTTAPETKLQDGADEARFTLSSGITYLQAAAAAGKLYLSSMFSADLTELKAKFGGAFHSIYTRFDIAPDPTDPTDNDSVMTPAGTAQAMAPDFESAEQTITNNSAVTIAHGLGVRPRQFMAVLRNKTAEHGYSVGDEVLVESYGSVSTVGDFGTTVVADATNMTLATNNGIRIRNKSTGAQVTLTNANWRYVVRAWK